MKNILKVQFLLLILINTCYAQFDPAAGKKGSLAVHKDSSIISFWATSCTFELGLVQCNDPSLGNASVGNAQSAIGPAGTGGVLSLGDGGSAILKFDQAIKDVPGPDIAVFESSFSDYFLELAFVEVSSDGVNYVRFPAQSLTQTQTQIGSFDLLDPTKIYNLAGKHRVLFGTPFDLAELADSPQIDISAIQYIKIIDVIGNISDSSCISYDDKGRMINDPWPTPFESSGFDLDAVAALNQRPNAINTPLVTVWASPNPIESGGVLHFPRNISIDELQIYNFNGQLISSENSPDTYWQLPSLQQGVYHLRFKVKGILYYQKLLVI